MKRFSLFLLLSIVSLVSFAQLQGDGYYRVTNLGTEVKGNTKGVKETTYMWIVDCNGEVIIQASQADTHAMQGHPASEDPTSEPASIIYVQSQNQSAQTYDLYGQGVGVHDLISYYPKITEIKDATNPAQNKYLVSGSKAGVTSYLCLTNVKKSGGYYPTSTSYSSYDITFRQWQLHPVSSSSSTNYFGLKPTLEVNGKHYAPFYASFPFKFASSGMKAYYVKSISDSGIAILKEITSEVIPGETPLLIECSSQNTADNKLDLQFGNYAAPTDNLLGGKYFCNFFIDIVNNPTVRTAFDAKTMRTWNVQNGKLVLSTATDNLVVNAKGDDGSRYIKANTSFLDLSKAPAAASFNSLTVMTEEEYNKSFSVPVSSITLNTASAALKVGGTTQLTATVAPNDATDKTVSWSSSNDAVATVDANGLVTAKALGEATITVKANDGSNVSATCKITVEPTLVTSISLNAASANLKAGETKQLTATVAPNDATSKAVTWSSSNNAVATVDANGLVTAKAVGEATITVKANDGSNVSATCKITVNPTLVSAITLDKTTATLKVNGTQQLTATIAPADATSKAVTWASSDEKIATVDANGLVTAKAVGEATITVTAKDGSKVSASCKITVEPTLVSEITLDATTKALKSGETAQLTAKVTPADATNQKLEWSSSNEKVATVNATGLVTAVGAGTADITVKTTDGSNKSAKCTVTVTPSIILVSSVTLDKKSASLKAKETVQLAATVAPNDATNKEVTWTSSDEKVAKVDAKGLVTAVAVGNALIIVKANDASAKADTCKITVDPTLVSSIALNDTTAELTVGDTQLLVASVTPEDATDKTVTWTSSDPKIASVDKDGLVKALAKGSAVITVTANDASKLSATCVIKVNPKMFTVTALANDSTLGTVEGSGVYEDGTVVELKAVPKGENRFVAWSDGATNNPYKVTVNADLTITATFEFIDGIAEINAATVNNNAIYNVSGVRMNRLQKGINIVNGKKVILK